MTFLLNAEIGPAFMQDGRVTFTAEKVDHRQVPSVFYQLSGRRINWDLSDYHPLLAQRASSTDTFTDDLRPSVDFQQATEIREGLDRNFVLILSDAGAHGGGGALATFNRSIGPFQADRGEVTFLRSVMIVDPAATGQAGTAGVYRSPFSLPNGEILASYAADVTDPAPATPGSSWSPSTSAPARGACWRATAACPTSRRRWATSAPRRLLFSNLPQLVFGGHHDDAAAATASCTFPTCPCWPRCWARTCAERRNVEGFDQGGRAQGLRGEPAARADGLVGTRGLHQPHVAREGVVRVGPLAEGAAPGGQAADLRVRRRRAGIPCSR